MLTSQGDRSRLTRKLGVLEAVILRKAMSTRLPSGTLDKLWADHNNWRAGIVYVCRDDPRLIVPKRPKWGGWTPNLAHPVGWITLLVCLLSIIVPTACFAAVGLAFAALPLVLFVGLFWCILGWFFSSSARYEEPITSP